MGKETKLQDIQDYYYDCAFQVTEYTDRRFSSGWTPEGIKMIESEYCHRIQNIGNEVVQLIKIDRTSHDIISTHKMYWWDDYTELPLDQDFYSYDRVAFCYNLDNFIELPEPKHYNKKVGYKKLELTVPEYTYTHPTYSAKHKGEDPEMLRELIIKNPNLLLNLNNILDSIKNK